MASVTIKLELPNMGTYNAEELTHLLKRYANSLLASTSMPKTKSYMKLRGVGKSTLSYEEMRKKALSEKYGL